MVSSSHRRIRASLSNAIDNTSSGCTSCGICVKECAFLRKYGTPKWIAEEFDATDPATLGRSFECSLCGLCSAVCPQKLDLDALYIEMRREAVDRGIGNFRQHKPLVNYERLGTSRRFTLYRLPEGCKTVFFPGCSLSGTRPGGVKRIFEELKKVDPSTGIVFDCCMKPSHMLGRESYVESMFGALNRQLTDMGVEEVLVACPNCQKMFTSFGMGLKVKTVWEALDEAGLTPDPVTALVSVHDPCVVRDAPAVHEAVRNLIRRQGLVIQEMPHSGRKTVCCGKGGAVDLLAPELASGWGKTRREEAAGRRIITYCASCAHALSRHTPTYHLVDLLFAPEKTMAGKVKGAGAPITYLNRLLLKRSYRRKKGFAVDRERSSAAFPQQPKKGR